jgi:hypothetical protein
MQTPVDALSELRVRAGKDPVELTAAHPFFWAGYVVVDSGWRPEEPEAAGQGDAPAEPAVAGAPGVPPPRPGEPAPEAAVMKGDAVAEPAAAGAAARPQPSAPVGTKPATPPPKPTPPAAASK